MKLSNIFKKSKKNTEAVVIKVDRKKLEKIVGGALESIGLPKVTPKISKESHG
jgi:hypothetical protein